VETADRFLDDLLAAVDKYPDSTALQAAAILKAWDRKTDAASKGAVLFSAWFEKLTPTMYATRWDPFKPVTTPDGLSDEKQAVSLLVQAAKEVKEKYGSMDIAWGEVFRLRMNGIDLPANGGLQQEGILCQCPTRKDADNKFRAEGGETFIAVTEFGKSPQASVLLGYGNATQEGSKHRTDQLNLLSEKKLRQALLTKEDVRKHLERKEVLKTKF
jgi:Protein related to penicillin acylase